jgi:hypothetical protein
MLVNTLSRNTRIFFFGIALPKPDNTFELIQASLSQTMGLKEEVAKEEQKSIRNTKAATLSMVLLNIVVRRRT